ncbi:site-specific integrase [Rapidithrix thailandica]|uniref:Site-specific integrase n=1 Tax=Rapidithrix thailandica TaxID=413964 RepID=A0AAW9S171_9BACT
MKTFGINFYTRKARVKNGTTPIYCRVTVNGVRVSISLKCSINLANWNKHKGMAKGSKQEVDEINTYLEQVRAKVVKCYRALLLETDTFTAEDVKKKFLGEDDEQKRQTLLGLIDYHNERFRDILEWGTLKNYFTTKKYLEKFLLTKYKRKDIPLKELRYKFLTDFELFLRKHQPKDHQKPMGNNTVMKHIERMRKTIHLAIDQEWLEKDPFARFKRRLEKTDRGFLNTEELECLQKKRLTIPRVEYVRDLFIFSCYTGLAYSDVMRLTPQQLTIGIDGERWIITARKKTDNPVRIPLLSVASEIIEKYKDHLRAEVTQTLFPVISNQKLNSYLKEIADLCGIKKNLSFHLARHTFATTVTLANGVPIESVSKMLGHTKIATTQIYARVLEKKLSEDMSQLRQKLSREERRKEKQG